MHHLVHPLVPLATAPNSPTFSRIKHKPAEIWYPSALFAKRTAHSSHTFSWTVGRFRLGRRYQPINLSFRQGQRRLLLLLLLRPRRVWCAFSYLIHVLRMLTVLASSFLDSHWFKLTARRQPTQNFYQFIRNIDSLHCCRSEQQQQQQTNVRLLFVVLSPCGVWIGSWA